MLRNGRNKLPNRAIQETGNIFSNLPEEPEELRPLVFADGKTDLGKEFKPAQGWISRSHLQNFLHSEISGNFRHEKEEKFSCAEVRYGIGVDENTFAAEEGKFFITPRMRVKQEWDKQIRTLRQHVFSVQVRFAAEDARTELEKIISKNIGAFFGGERGRVKISLRKNNPAPDKPNSAILAENGRFFLYLCTPSLFEEGWRPKQWPACFNEAKLVGVALHKPCRVSGWSHETKEGKPRSLFHAVPGGTVYYFETAGWDESRFTALLNEYHFSTSISDYYPCAGFGITCIGTWKKGDNHAA